MPLTRGDTPSQRLSQCIPPSGAPRTTTGRTAAASGPAPSRGSARAAHPVSSPAMAVLPCRPVPLSVAALVVLGSAAPALSPLLISSPAWRARSAAAAPVWLSGAVSAEPGAPARAAWACLVALAVLVQRAGGRMVSPPTRSRRRTCQCRTDPCGQLEDMGPSSRVAPAVSPAAEEVRRSKQEDDADSGAARRYTRYGCSTQAAAVGVGGWAGRRWRSRGGRRRRRGIGRGVMGCLGVPDQRARRKVGRHDSRLAVFSYGHQLVDRRHHGAWLGRVSIQP